MENMNLRERFNVLEYAFLTKSQAYDYILGHNYGPQNNRN
jgi:hypothetical protein